MIESMLERVGLSKNEARVYLCLAELGKTTATIVAKKQNMPRSTAYSVLDTLVLRGVVAIEQTPGGTYYLANQPSSLKRMIEREKLEQLAQIGEKENAVGDVLREIQPFFKNTNYSVPKLQFFEGTTNVESMLYDCCRDWQASISQVDYTWWGYQDHHFVEQYREWLDYYWASMHADERILLLSNKSTTEKQLKGKVAKRDVKVVPKSFEFSSTIWVLGEYVITIMTRQKPHYAFQLKDSVFAANQRILFQQFWSMLG